MQFPPYIGLLNMQRPADILEARGQRTCGWRHSVKAMIQDIVRAGLVVAVLAAGSSLLIETRRQLAVVDVAHRQCVGQQVYAIQPSPQQSPGRLQQFGRATLSFADAALGIVR